MLHSPRGQSGKMPQYSEAMPLEVTALRDLSEGQRGLMHAQGSVRSREARLGARQTQHVFGGDEPRHRSAREPVTQRARPTKVKAIDRAPVAEGKGTEL